MVEPSYNSANLSSQLSRLLGTPRLCISTDISRENTVRFWQDFNEAFEEFPIVIQTTKTKNCKPNQLS